jgi:hypothetical protein
MTCYTSGWLELTPEQIKAMERIIDTDHMVTMQDRSWEKEEYEQYLSDLEETL